MEDLFTQYDKLPQELQAILDKYGELETYKECEAMLKECNAIGYTFDYYLDATPYNLRKMQEQEIKLSPSQQMGEDIRAAKAIFEQRFGEQTNVDVNLWMEFANEVREHMGLQNLQETAEKLNLKIRKP